MAIAKVRFPLIVSLLPLLTVAGSIAVAPLQPGLANPQPVQNLATASPAGTGQLQPSATQGQAVRLADAALLPSATAGPWPGATPTMTPTATWAMAGPGTVRVPILLYHHVRAVYPEDTYSRTPQDFEADIALLADLGYQTVSTDEMADAALYGAPLPERPVILTFDDGYADVFEVAYPILDAHGYTATVYVVASLLEAEGYLSVAQLRTLAEAGWEIGSHSLTHPVLTRQSGPQLHDEIVGSRLVLEEALGIEVHTFSYPFGSSSEDIRARVLRAGYRTAMGVGAWSRHCRGNLDYVGRAAVLAGWSLDDLVAALEQ
jgi:peptidoglycan/xylan/chitin deacetylase (PgdA/CDA1 family)